ncbi:MAG: hypothetical protein Q9211_000310 [Gyalolechia sp. 1 TL-2023]
MIYTLTEQCRSDGNSGEAMGTASMFAENVRYVMDAERWRSKWKNEKEKKDRGSRNTRWLKNPLPPRKVNGEV